jgi:phosphoribosyl-ATP pyrophosphohydrolase
MRSLFFFLFFLTASFLFCQVSEIPAAQLLAEQGLNQLEKKEYEEALQSFLQAQDLDQENTLLESYITSLTRIVSLENIQADPQEIDRFLEEREEHRDEEQELDFEEDGEIDFITQEQYKEKARLDRSRGKVSLYYPLLNSSNGGSELDSNLRLDGDLLEGVSLDLVFYPDLFSRTIGLEGGYGSFSVEINDEVNVFDELGTGLILRNFFNEQPGIYSLIGTRLWGGVLFGENLSDDSRDVLSFYRFEVFFRDPFIYRFIKTEATKNIALKGKVSFSLLDDTYMLGYEGGASVRLGDRLDLIGKFIYRNYLEDDSFYPSWTCFMGMEYVFR